VHAIAAQGTQGAGSRLPHFEQIQRSFGSHDISGVQAYTGGDAAAAAGQLGARAYAHGNAVAFAGQPDLHTAAHEAAHVVQQRGGVQLKGGIDGGASDPYEQHADAVADRVVRGESAADLLDHAAGGGSGSLGVQRKEGGGTGNSEMNTAHVASGAPGKAGEGEAKPVVPVLPGQPAQKLTIAIGSGVVTGSISLEISVGAGGVPLGTERVKALQTEAQLKLNGLAGELGASVLSGNLEGDVVEGIKVTVEFTGGTVATDGEETTKDLLAIRVGLEGDITKLVGNETPGVSCKISGSVQVALGDKLAEKLRDLARKELEEKMYAMEMEDAAKELAGHEHELAEMRARAAALEASGGSREAIHELEEEIAERTADLAARGKSFEELGERLLESRKAARGIVERMEGAAARRIAKVMERKSVKLIAEQLARVLPYVDIAMLAIDLGTTVYKIHELIHEGARFVIVDSPLPPDDEGHPQKGSADEPASTGGASGSASAGPGSTSDASGSASGGPGSTPTASGSGSADTSKAGNKALPEASRRSQQRSGDCPPTHARS
jgi:hypothetical protein